MSFFIIAAVLAWSAFKSMQNHEPLWRMAFFIFGAAASIALGFRGMQIKHGPKDPLDR